jgi:hypothetical protein
LVARRDAVLMRHMPEGFSAGASDCPQKRLVQRSGRGSALKPHGVAAEINCHMNTRSRRSFWLETSLSTGLLVLLAVIAAVILMRQSHFNPAVLQLTADQVVGGRAEAPPAAPAVAALVTAPRDVTVLTAPETFDADTLSDKIDGKAELYLSAGFKRLRCQRFSAGAESWMEIFIFDMASPQNAFAVYSSQQREDAIPTSELGPYAYRTANALYWVHGPYYVELIASEASEAMSYRMQALAAAFNRATPVAAAAITEAGLFPAHGLDPRSITLIPADAFGFENFDRVFTAAYKVDGLAMTAFVSERPSPDAAAELAAAYRDFLLTYGGKAMGDSGLSGAVVVEILEEFNIIFTRGVYIAGVHAAADRDRAAALARSLATRIEESTRERR